MKASLVAGLGLGAATLMLAGCGGSSSAVGANSADSITTTAVGNVVATIPSPTPTPTDAAADNATDVTADAADDNAAAASDTSDTSDTTAH